MLGDDWFFLYVLTRLDAVRGLLGGVVVLSAMALFAALMGVVLSFDVSDMNIRRISFLWLRRFLICLCASASVMIVTPSRNDMIFIVGGSQLLDAIKSPRASEIGSKTLDVIEKYITPETEERLK